MGERLTEWKRRGRAAQARVDAARADHKSLEFGFGFVRHDAQIGGGLLAGALAYRFFVFLLPASLLLVSGLGLYAGAVDKSRAEVASEAGLHGLVASEVASAASGRHRAVVFLVMLPAVVYGATTLYRAIARVHAIVWLGSGQGVKTTRRGLGVFASTLVLQFVVVEIVGWLRRSSQFSGLAALLLYLVVVGGAWLAVSLDLPRRDVRWPRLVPGALLVGVGLLLINIFNVYVTTRLVENRANAYGALGIATALLFSLVLVGRLIVSSAELNAALSKPEPPTRS